MKPFWNISALERMIHEGLSDCGQKEWFKFIDAGMQDFIVDGLCGFYEKDRDMNSVDFIYRVEFQIERDSRRVQALPAGPRRRNSTHEIEIRSGNASVSRSMASRRIRWPHALCDLRALLPLNDADVVLALQIQPELCAVTKVTSEAHGRIGGDRAAAIQNVRDAARRHANVERQPVGAELAGRQFALQ